MSTVVIVIVAVPSPTAVITPFSTVATLGSDVFHVSSFVSPRITLAVTLYVSPTYIVTGAVFALIVRSVGLSY